MPVWLMIVFSAVPGCVALFVAAFHMGAMRRDVHDIISRAVGWDQAAKDLAYIKGRFEESDVNRMSQPKAQHRERARAVAVG